MNPTLTIQEEELARTLKSQGKSSQEILTTLARQRTQSITPVIDRPEFAPRVGTLRDIPSDIVETGRGIADTVTRKGQQLAGAWQDPNATLPMKVAATGPIMGTALTGVAGEAIVGGAKLFTSDEFEKAVVQKIGQAGQAAADTNAAKKLVNWWERQDNNTKFMLQNVMAPQAEFGFDVATAGVFGAGARATRGAVGEAIQQTTEAASNIRMPSGMPSFGRTPEPVVAPVPPEVRTTVVKGFDTAIKPNLASKQTPTQRAKYETQVAQGLESIANNAENLRFVDEASGEVVTGRLPQNLKEFVDGLEQTKQTIFKQYDDLAEKAGEAGAKIDTVRIANELDAIINSKALKLSNPESIAYANSVRDRLLSTRALNALDAQDVIRNYNNSLDAFYRNPTPEGLTRNAVDALVANQLRRALDDEIDALTGANYQGLKSEYAALKAIERDVMRAYNRDARRNTKGLIDFTDVLTGGQVVGGILSMNPAVIGQGLAGKAIAGAIKMWNDPNRKVRQIFDEMSRYRRPEGGTPTPTRKQLPPARPDAPRSEVGSGAPIATGGQTPTGRVEPGITERAVEGAIKQPTKTGFFKKQAERFKSPESFIKAVNGNPAWLAKLKAAGVTPEEIAKLTFMSVGALSLPLLLDEELSPLGFLVVGSIIGGSGARKAFAKKIATKVNEADLIEMSAFSGAYREGAFKTVNGEMKVAATKNFTQKEAQQALDGALRRAEDFPVISDASLGELAKTFDEVAEFSKDRSFNKGATPKQLSAQQAKASGMSFDGVELKPILEEINALRPNQKPIGAEMFMRGDELINISDVVARERFDIPKLKKLSFGGSDRDVYDLGDGNVLKIAKSARGLAQNQMADWYAADVGLIPNIKEIGRNYVVFEKVNAPDANTKKMVSELKKVDSYLLMSESHPKHWGAIDQAYAILNKYGYPADELANYGQVLWGDLNVIRNWGTRNGKPILLDEGSLNGTFVKDFRDSAQRGVSNMDDPEFREIYNISKDVRKKYGDLDKKTMYGITGLVVGGGAYSSQE